jgi:hypothetical protein
MTSPGDHRVVALWEPEVTPPDAWLLPSVLYQDQISTFAPLMPDGSSESTEAARLESLLGPLYRRFSVVDLWQQADDEEALALLRARLPMWQREVAALAARTGDEDLKSWLARMEDWPAIVVRRVDLGRVASADLGVASADLEIARAEVRSCEKSVAELQVEFSRHNEALKEFRASRRRRRKSEYGSLIAEHDRLVALRRADKGNDDLTRAIQGIQRSLRSVADSLPPQARPRELTQLDDLAVRIREQKDGTILARHALASARERVTDSERRLRVATNTQEMGNTSWDRCYLARAEVNPNLDRLLLGKVTAPVFEFLFTEGGMWLHRENNLHYRSTVIGPALVVRDVLAIIAASFCSQNDGWVTLSAAKSTRQPDSTEELLAIAIQALLPAPASGGIDDAADFRRKHEEELAIIRTTLARDISSMNQAHVDDAIDAMRLSISKPLEEIRRALELNRKLSLGWVRQSALLKTRGGVKALVASLASATIATPLFGNTINLGSSAAGVVGGAGIAVVATGAGVAGMLWQRERLDRRVDSGAFRYVYELGCEFGLRP